MKFFTRIWINKLLRDILRQKLLFFAVILLCFFGVGSYIALSMGTTNLEASYKSIYKKTNFADAELFTHPDVWFNISEVETVVTNFRSLHPEIQAVNYRLIIETNYNVTSPLDNHTRKHLPNGRAIGINWNLDEENRINDLIFESGVYFNASSPNDSIFVEAHFAHYFRLNTGEYLKTQIVGQNFNYTIQGIVFSPEYLVVIPSQYDFIPTNRFGVIYLPLETLQTYTNLTGLANNVIIKMKPGINQTTRDIIVNELFEVLNNQTEDAFGLSVMQEYQVSNWALRLDLEEIEEIALILPIVVLGVATISIYITLGRIVQSQRRIVGIASSLGYLPNDILLHYICFALIIGGFGSVLGIIFGIIISGGVTWIYAYFMGFPQIIEIQLQIHLVINGFLTGLGISFLSGAIPAWNASRMIPREALQVMVTVEKGKHSLLERIIPINPFGLRFIISVRNLFRRKFRTFTTIIAIAAAVGILVVSFAFIDSISAGVYQQFNETSQYDIIVKYDGYRFADLGVKEDIAYIQNLSGVLSVDPVLQIPSILYVEEKQQEVLITAWNTSDPRAHKFSWMSSQDTLQTNNSMVVCTALARQFNIDRGSSIRYGYPRIPYLETVHDYSWRIWNISIWAGTEFARDQTLEFITKQISSSQERISFSKEASETYFNTSTINISGVSKEIWGKMAYTTAQTITDHMGIDIFKRDFDIDLTPFTQLILKVTQSNNITLLEEIKDSISQIEGVRGIEYNYDMHQSVDIMMAAFNSIVFVFLIFACVLAAAAIFTTIYLNFQERQREIATMMSIGLSDLEFLFIMTIENLAQAIMGILAGIPLGFWVASWLLDNILRTFYFEIFIQTMTWIILWVGVISIVLLSQLPAIYHGAKLDLAVVTKELSS